MLWENSRARNIFLPTKKMITENQEWHLQWQQNDWGSESEALECSSHWNGISYKMKISFVDTSELKI